MNVSAPVLPRRAFFGSTAVDDSTLPSRRGPWVRRRGCWTPLLLLLLLLGVPIDDAKVIGAGSLLGSQGEPVQVFVEAGASEVSEAGGVLRFLLVRTGAPENPEVFHVRYRVEGMDVPWGTGEQWAASARDGIDFVAQEGLVEFGPGMTRQTIEVTLLNDAVVDGPRGLHLGFLGSPDLPSLQFIDQGNATKVILDDESLVLEQETVIAPFLPEVALPPRAFPLSGGKMLLLADHRLLQLQPSGLPDTGFGWGNRFFRIAR